MGVSVVHNAASTKATDGFALKATDSATLKAAYDINDTTLKVANATTKPIDGITLKATVTDWISFQAKMSHLLFYGLVISAQRAVPMQEISKWWGFQKQIVFN